jgi:hypothetical protein
MNHAPRRAALSLSLLARGARKTQNEIEMPDAASYRGCSGHSWLHAKTAAAIN